MSEHTDSKRNFAKLFPDISKREQIIESCAVDDTDKRILMLRYIKFKSFIEISDELKISYSQVSKRHKRAFSVLNDCAKQNLE